MVEQKIEWLEVSRMLILTRIPGESLWIGDDIKIELINSGRDGVILDIAAPDGLVIRDDENNRKRTFDYWNGEGDLG